MRRLSISLLVAFLAISILPSIVSAASTMQFNTISLNPYYVNSMTASTNYTKWVVVNPPNNMASVVSSIVKFKIFTSGQSTNYTLYVNGQYCGFYYVATAYANSGQYEISFDCTPFIKSSGNYSLVLRASVGAGASYGWLDITYMSKPPSATIGATDYPLDNSQATVFAKVYEGDSAVSNGFCTALVFYPNGTQFTSFSMDYVTGSRGLYSKTFVKPTVPDVYPVDVECVRPFNASKQNRLIASKGGEFFMNSSGIGTATRVITDINQNTGEQCFDSWDERISDFPSSFKSYRYLENVTNITVWMKQGVGSNTFVITMYFYKMTDKGEINIGQTSLTTALTTSETAYTLPNERLDFVWDETSLLKARLCVISTTTTSRTLTFYYNSTTRYSGFQINTMNINTSLDFVVGGASEVNVRDFSTGSSVNASIASALNNLTLQNIIHDLNLNSTRNNITLQMLAHDLNLNYTRGYLDSAVANNFTSTNNLIRAVNVSIITQTVSIINQLTALQNQLILVSQNLTSVNSTVLGINLSIMNQLSNVNASLSNQISNLATDANLAPVLGNLSIIQSQLTNVSINITSINSSTTQQLNQISAQIVNTNATLYQMMLIHDLNLNVTRTYLDLNIANNFTMTNGMITSVNNTVLSVNGSIWGGLNSIISQLNTALSYVVSVNNTVLSTNSSIHSRLDTIDSSLLVIGGKLDSLGNNLTFINSSIYAMNNTLVSNQITMLVNQQLILNNISIVQQNLSTISNQILGSNASIVYILNNIESEILVLNSTINTMQNQLISINDTVKFEFIALNSMMASNFTSQNATMNNWFNSLFSYLDNAFGTVGAWLSGNFTYTNNRISAVNASLSGQLDQVSLQILSVNNTLVSINTTLTAKIDSLQSVMTYNFAAVNQSLLNLQGNLTLANVELQQISTTLNATNSSIHARFDYVDTQLNQTQMMIAAHNASVFSQFMLIDSYLMNITNDLSVVNGNVLSVNATVNYWGNLLYGAIASVNNTVNYWGNYLDAHIVSVEDNMNQSFDDVYVNQTRIYELLLGMNSSIAYINSSVGTVNYTYFNENFANVTGLIVSSNYTIMEKITNVNASLSNQMSDMKAYLILMNQSISDRFDITDGLVGSAYSNISLAIVSVNQTVLASNSSIMNKLFLVQDEILSVNNTLKDINISLSNQISALNFSVDMSAVYGNLTEIKNEIAYANNTLNLAITSVNNTVLSTNASIMGELSSVQLNLNGISSQVTGLSNDMAANFTYTNNLIGNVNASLSGQMTSLALQISNIDSKLDAVNSTLYGRIDALEYAMANNFTYVNSLLYQLQANCSYVQDQLTSVLGNMSYLQNFTYGMNQTLSDRLDSVDVQLNQTQQLIRDHNASVFVEFQNINDELTNITDLIVSSNATIMWKLYMIQDEIASVNDTVKAINASLSQQMLDMNISISSEITWAYNELSGMIVSVNNSVLSTNQSIMNQLLTMEQELLEINSTVSNMNFTVDLSEVNQKLDNIQNNLTYMNASLTQIGIDVNDLYTFVYNMDNSMALNFTALTNLVNSVNGSLSMQISDNFANISISLWTLQDTLNSAYYNVTQMIVSVNGTVLSINTSIMDELLLARADIASVNASINALNFTTDLSGISQQISNMQVNVTNATIKINKVNEELLAINQSLMGDCINGTNITVPGTNGTGGYYYSYNVTNPDGTPHVNGIIELRVPLNNTDCYGSIRLNECDSASCTSETELEYYVIGNATGYCDIARPLNVSGSSTKYLRARIGNYGTPAYTMTRLFKDDFESYKDTIAMNEVWTVILDSGGFFELDTVNPIAGSKSLAVYKIALKALFESYATSGTVYSTFLLKNNESADTTQYRIGASDAEFASGEGWNRTFTATDTWSGGSYVYKAGGSWSSSISGAGGDVIYTKEVIRWGDVKWDLYANGSSYTDLDPAEGGYAPLPYGDNIGSMLIDSGAGAGDMSLLDDVEAWNVDFNWYDIDYTVVSPYDGNFSYMELYYPFDNGTGIVAQDLSDSNPGGLCTQSYDGTRFKCNSYCYDSAYCQYWIPGKFNNCIYNYPFNPGYPYDTGAVNVTAHQPYRNITECMKILEPGRYILERDLIVDATLPDETCIDVRANDVEVDFNGHTVDCNGYYYTGAAIRYPDRGTYNNLTIHNGYVTNCAQSGIFDASLVYDMNITNSGTGVQGYDKDVIVDNVYGISNTYNLILYNSIATVSDSVFTSGAILDIFLQDAVAIAGFNACNVTYVNSNPVVVIPACSETGSIYAYWKLDETEGKVAYDSFSSYNLNVEKYPDWVRGHDINAFDFNGINSVTNNYDICLTDNGTISAWVNPRDAYLPDYASGGSIVIGQVMNSGFSPYTIWYSPFGYPGDIGCSVNDVVSPTASIPLDQWTMATCKWNSTAVYLYLDGNYVSQSAAQTAYCTSGETISIGNFIPGGTWDQRHFNGTIDDVVISTAMSDVDILTMYQKQSPIRYQNQYGMDKDFTITMWANANNTHGAYGVGTLFSKFDYAGTSTASKTEGFIDGSGYLTWYMYDWANHPCFVQYGVQNLADDAWHLLSFRKSGDLYSIYIDGSSVASSTCQLYSIWNKEDLSLMSGYNTNGYTGKLDEFRFYDYALSSTDIGNLVSFDPLGSFAAGGTSPSYNITVNATCGILPEIKDMINNTNATIMWKLYWMQDEIASVNNTVKAVNQTLPGGVWSYWNRTLTESVNVSGVLDALSNFLDVRYAGGTEYSFGETAQIAYQFLDTISGSPTPINDGNCNATVWLPNKTALVINVSMTYLPGSAAVYYYTLTFPDVEGVYTSNAVCGNDTSTGYGSSSFHVAPWANQIYSNSSYLATRDYMTAYLTAAEPTSRVCLDNTTLRQTVEYITNIDGTPMNVTKYQDFVCSAGCDQVMNRCIEGSAWTIWGFLIISVTGLYLMFGRKDIISQIIGSLMVFLLGSFVLISGIDFVWYLGLQGTVGGSYIINNVMTNLIGWVFLGLGLYRLASAAFEYQRRSEK